VGKRLFFSVLLFVPLLVMAESSIEVPLVVTATRTATTTDETLASVTVIDSEDIENSQAQSIQELLQGIPGLSISNNGGPGKATSFFMRGTESRHVLVLINGVKVGSATLGTTAFQDIPIDQVERIEVVRGPRSSLYGSEAIGGVIQIFTKKGGGDTRPYFSMGAGNYSTTRGSIGVSGGGDNGWYNVSAAGLDTEGFNSCRGKPFPAGAGCFTDEPDDDGYSNRSLSARAGHKFSNGIEFDVHGLQTVGKSEFDGSFQNNSEFDQKVYGGSFKANLLSRWNAKLLAGRSIDTSKNFLGKNFSSKFETARNTASLQNDIFVASTDVLTVGLDYQNDQVKSTTVYDENERDNYGGFAQYQGNIWRINYNLAARRDDNEQFGKYSTGSGGLRIDYLRALWTSVSYGTAFAAPSFNNLYFPGFGNANLDPEESATTELAIGGEVPHLVWSLHGYQTRINNLIAFDSFFNVDNINKAEIIGAELDLDIRLWDWLLKVGLTGLKPENKSGGADDGNILPRRSQNSAKIDVQYQIAKWTNGLTVFYDGKRYDDLANTKVLDGYTLVGMRTEIAADEEWRLELKIDNLMKVKYETAEYYNQPGRTVMFNIRYSPKL